MNEWVGPGNFLEVDGKSVKVELEGRVVLLSIDKIKKKGDVRVRGKGRGN